jgi:hypothetical protein
VTFASRPADQDPTVEGGGVEADEVRPGRVDRDGVRDEPDVGTAVVRHQRLHDLPSGLADADEREPHVRAVREANA